MTDVELRLTADLDDATKEVAGFRKQYADLVKVVEKPLRQVNAFRDLESSLESTSREMRTAKDRVRELAAELARTAIPTKELQADYRNSTQELRRLERQESVQIGQLRKQQAELKRAGVDTRNLANEQKRLQAEMAKGLGAGRGDASFQSALQGLGVAQARGTREAIAEQQRQFELLRKSGKLTFTEIAIAQNTLRQSISAAAGQTAGLTAATTTWQASLAGVRGELIAGAAAFGGFALVAGNSFGKFADYEQRIAEIGTISDLTGGQLDDLSQDVRQLSLDMGKDAAGSAAALYEILSSGVSPDNSLGVLAQSTKAAVAGLTDTKTAATVGLAVINSYGEGVDKLGTRYDQLFLTVKNGVVTFPELAASIGQVLPTAASAEVSFSEVSAAMAELTKQGIRAPIAVTSLRSAINQLAAPSDEAKKAMKELGIEWNGLSGTLQQIAQKKIGFEALRQIIPDTEGRTAVQALTRDVSAFVAQVDEMERAGGTTEAAYGKMKDTPAAQMERFRAAVNDLQISLGQAVAAGLPLVNLFTDMLNAFNSLPEPLRVGLVSIVAFGVAGVALKTLLTAIRLPFALFLAQLGATPAAAVPAGAAMDALGVKALKLSTLLKGGGLLAAFTFTGSQLSELYSLYQQMQELEKSQEDYKQALDSTIQAMKPYSDAVVLAGSEVAALTETERQSYLERLKNAEAYYSKLAEQISRADAEKDGPTAAVSPEALNAAKQASAYRRAREAIEGELAAREKSEAAHGERLKKIKDNELKTVKEKLAAQLKAYDDANTRLEAARKAREGIQKEFNTLANEMAGGTSAAGSSFGDLNQAKVNARNALQSGDSATAISEARRAGEILRELKSAGESTYGFEGIANELGKIATAAADIDVDGAKSSAEAAKAKVDELVQYASALQRISVGFQSDAESEEQTKARLVALAQAWAKYMQIPVTYVVQGADPNAARADGLIDPAPAVPGFATGGHIRGPGTGTSDSILARLSDGEFVFRADAVKHYGPELLAQMNARRLPKFAAGGLLSNRSLPSIPQINPSLMAGLNGSQGRDLGRVDLNVGGESFSLLADGDQFNRLLRRTATKIGRTHK